MAAFLDEDEVIDTIVDLKCGKPIQNEDDLKRLKGYDFQFTARKLGASIISFYFRSIKDLSQLISLDKPHISILSSDASSSLQSFQTLMPNSPHLGEISQPVSYPSPNSNLI